MEIFSDGSYELTLDERVAVGPIESPYDSLDYLSDHLLNWIKIAQSRVNFIKQEQSPTPDNNKFLDLFERRLKTLTDMATTILNYEIESISN